MPLFRSATGEFLRGLNLLGQLLTVGQSLRRAVPEVIAVVEHRRARQMWEGVGQRLLMGMTLTEALAMGGTVSESVLALIRAGEDHGNLPEALLRASGQFVFDPASGRKVRPVVRDFEGGPGQTLELRSRPVLECAVEGPEVKMAHAVLGEAVRVGATSIGIDAVWLAPTSNSWPPDEICVRKPVSEEGLAILASRPFTPLWYQRDGIWLDQGQLLLPVVKALIGQYLFLAEIPYWTQADGSGEFSINCLDAEWLIRVAYSSNRRPTLLIEVSRLSTTATR